MEELVKRIASDIIAANKLSEDKESLVTRSVKMAISQILIFCNRSDFPSQLEPVAALISEDMLKAQGVIAVPTEISSITRGDTSISYRDKAKLQEGAISFMQNYERQLVKFKKMKLPKDKNDRSR